MSITEHIDDGSPRGIDVQGTHYECVGPVRGRCGHRHRTLHAAQQCHDRDSSGCQQAGGYSDRSIVLVDDDGSDHVLPDAT